MNGWIDLRETNGDYDNPAELFFKTWDEVEKWFFNELPKLVPEAKLEEKWVVEKDIETRLECPGCKRHTVYKGTAIFDLRVPKPKVKSAKCVHCGHVIEGA